jgi:hypothetical protein
MSDERDRRTEPRISAILHAVILDDEQYMGRSFPVSGFSSTGAFLRRPDTDAPLPPIGSVVQVQFTWPPQSKVAPVFVEAKVVRAQPDGVGVQFDITA